MSLENGIYLSKRVNSAFFKIQQTSLNNFVDLSEGQIKYPHDCQYNICRIGRI